MDLFVLFYIALALLFLWKGGDLLELGVTSIALRRGLSPFVIGVTVVSIGSSLPEVAAAIAAAMTGAPAIAIGNAVGSNIANSLLIIGVAAMIWPIVLDRPRDLVLNFLVTLAVGALLVAGIISYPIGWVLIASIIIYIAGQVRFGSDEGDEAETIEAPVGVFKSWLCLVGGLAMILWSADFLVENAIIVVRQAGISETLIGASLVAFGTSVPELAISIVAALKRNTGLVVGNIIGSNVFNLTGVLGSAIISSPVEVCVDPRMYIHLITVAVAAALLLPVGQRKIGRLAGLAFFVLYFVYLFIAVQME